jgi:hypothetical protein
MDDQDQYLPRKSSAWRDGYDAYLSYSSNGGERPENPHWSGHLDGESVAYEQWQLGWDDAAWDS